MINKIIIQKLLFSSTGFFPQHIVPKSQELDNPDFSSSLSEHDDSHMYPCFSHSGSVSTITQSPIQHEPASAEETACPSQVCSKSQITPPFSEQVSSIKSSEQHT